MKVIFLDIDGVLNTYYTKETIEQYTFVSEDKILLLKELIDKTDAKIVLSSTWRRGWLCKECDDPEMLTSGDLQDVRLFNALQAKLAEYDIHMLGYTDDFGLRGEEIDLWLKQWDGEPIESFVILDDMSGAELRPHSRYLIQTSMSEGLNEKHVARAIKILNDKK